MDKILFANIEEFHKWLIDNHQNHEGIWIRFDKSKRTSTLTANQALDEALCFGWIDGQMKSIDEQYYEKYFAKRTKKSIWSLKNEENVARLISEGKMMASGLLAVESAKKDGRWEQANQNPIDYSIEDFILLLKEYEMALDQYLKMSPSIQKTYALSYYALKKMESRERRLLVIVDRLNKKLPPM